MDRKKSLIILCGLIILAVVIGLVLVNKGDGPVAGTIISSVQIDTEEEYKNLENGKDKLVFIVTADQMSKSVEKFKTNVPQGNDLYANLKLVECRKGTKVRLKWICNKLMVKEEEKTLLTDQKGVIWYKLEGSMAVKGEYTIEGYIDNNKIFAQNFSIE